MKICGFEKFSMVDYDGLIACTVFTEGCNFVCPFCQNSSLALNNIHNDYIDQQEIIDYLTKRKGLVDAVCISGGEPTLQKDLEEFIITIKNLGYKVKLDTNGQNPTKLLDLINKKLIDYVAMDIKNNLVKYGITIGINNFDTTNIQKSVEIIKTSGIAHEFRTTLVGQYHSISDIEEIAKWLEGEEKYYLQHFVDSGSCIKDGLTEVDKDTAIKMQNIASKYIKNVNLRGY